MWDCVYWVCLQYIRDDVHFPLLVIYTSNCQAQSEHLFGIFGGEFSGLA